MMWQQCHQGCGIHVTNVIKDEASMSTVMYDFAQLSSCMKFELFKLLGIY